MLWTIFIILLVLWVLGMVTSYTMGGFIHILLLISSGISDHKRNKRQKSSLEMVRFNMKSKDEISVICNAQPV